MKAGDFTELADAYAKYRPGYSNLLVSSLIGSLDVPFSNVRVADVGAGTGIFTRQLLEKEPASMVAIEPNEEMLKAGQQASDSNITWVLAGAESTGLAAASVDLVSMASSFHWPNTNDALAEFDRILDSGGVFTALWNPRITEKSPIELAIDGLLESEYGVKTRVSSGRGEFANGLEDTLQKSGVFKSVSYMHSLDVKRVATSHYIGAWTSVNDIQSQLGEAKFKDFIARISGMLKKVDFVEVHYLTRCWIAKKP